MKKVVGWVLLALIFWGVVALAAGKHDVREEIKAEIIEDATQKLAGEQKDYARGVNNPYMVLHVGGYSDSEIREYMRPILKEAGFSETQITTYFHVYDPLYTGRDMERIDEQKKAIEDILN